MNLRRIFFFSILFLFVGLTVWWLFCIPYSCERVYRAVPQNALFVSEHSKLGERWGVVARNPFTTALLVVAGFKQEDILNAVEDKGLTQIIKKFAARSTVIAYVDSFNGSGKPAWVLSSWVGGAGQVFRWSSRNMLASSSLYKKRLDNGRVIWIQKKKKQADPEIVFAITDGVLLACISANQSDIDHLIDRVERGAPLHPELRAHAASIGVNPLPDRGWIRWNQIRNGMLTPRRFEYVLNLSEESSVCGLFRGDKELILPDSLADGANGDNNSNNLSLSASPGLSELANLIGVPDAMVVVPFGLVEPLLSGRYVSRGVKIISRAVSSCVETNTAMFLSLYGGKLSGRILGIKVPAILSGVRVDDGSNSLARVSGVIDMLNAMYRLSIIARRDEICGCPMVVMDSTRQGVYGSIAPTDKSVVALNEKWVTLASSLGTLTNVIMGVKESAGDTSSKPTWVAGLNKNVDCAGYMWVNFESVAEAVKNAIAVYSLVLIAQNSPDAAVTRRNLVEIEKWVKVLAVVKQGSVRLKYGTDKFEVIFDLGPGK